MAVFRNDPTEWERLDWQLLQSSSITLYFDESVLAADVSWFERNGYSVRSLGVAGCESIEAVLTALGEVLEFPSHYGRNLAALNDCLSDVEVPGDGGLVLVLHSFDELARRFRPAAQAILDVLADNSRRFMLTGRRFLALVHSRDPRISFDPVGATPVLWNPEEWLSSKRGI